MKQARDVLLVGLLLLAAPLTKAAEVWVVQAETGFPDIPPCRPLVAWHTHLLFHNTTDSPVEIHLLSTSNGPMQTSPASLSVSPHRTASVRGSAPATLRWNPVLFGLWVSHLDVPEGVVVANRAEAEIAEMLTTDPNPPCSPRNHQFSAGLPLRIYRNLVPAGVTQYHLATDIGDYVEGNLHLDGRINVGVYNDAADAATAIIEVRCSAGPFAGGIDQPDPLLTTVTLSVPGRSVVQTLALASTAATPCPIPTDIGPFHVIVTSDRPGFSYVTGILNGALPKFPAAASFTE